MAGNMEERHSFEEGHSFEKATIQWHPGFYSAAELELISNKDALAFEREYNLSKAPLRMDLLIIKKLADVRIENEIGRIFKRYNIVEYKSPEDGLSIDDYYKTIGYACLYKGFGETVDEVPAEELTVSIFRERCPRELLKALKKAGLKVEQRFPGIYYIEGNVLFATQIVVTGQLSPKAHSGLRILSRNAREEDIRTFIGKAALLTAPGDRDNVEAVLQVSISANEKVYDEVRRDFAMCDALRELMKEEIEEERNKSRESGMAEGRAEGRVEGRENAILASIQNLMDSMKWTAEQAMDALKLPVDDRAKYVAKL
nr:hypothetical protein [uncultured Acetatifactor sp.]